MNQIVSAKLVFVVLVVKKKKRKENENMLTSSGLNYMFCE